MKKQVLVRCIGTRATSTPTYLARRNKLRRPLLLSPLLLVLVCTFDCCCFFCTIGARVCIESPSARRLRTKVRTSFVCLFVFDTYLPMFARHHLYFIVPSACVLCAYCCVSSSCVCSSCVLSSSSRRRLVALLMRLHPVCACVRRRPAATRRGWRRCHRAH